ncbi:MAG: hypothetical protein ACRC2R_24995 [Xenococcaceae cyanobacterium]
MRHETQQLLRTPTKGVEVKGALIGFTTFEHLFISSFSETIAFNFFCRLVETAIAEKLELPKI